MIRLLPLFALLAGCATTGAAPPPREGPVAIGQTAYVGGPRVRPVALIEDSRCPMNARCVWAGRVVLSADVLTGKRRQRMRLTLGEAVPVADGALTLTSVTPDRVAGSKPPAPRAYRFAFEFQGGL